MVTRREAVTTGALGALAAVAGEPGGAPPVAEGGAVVAEGANGEETQSPELIVAQALRDIAQDVNQIRLQLREALIGPSLSYGIVGEIRRQFGIFLRSNQKYPDYCEVGPGIFTDLYDWHVRYQLPIEISRVENRTALRFMFTWMILRPEQAEGYVGIPFDRG